MLVGRTTETRELDRMLGIARRDGSAALVIRGEPGIGKSALLAYAEAQATDMTVLRCTGVEAEYELPYAGMHQLVRSWLHLLDRLPAPQAGALRSALGLSADGVPDRFLVFLGLLSLLAEVSEEAPVLCCVDDAQWLDAPSAEALSFAVRRLEAERIAVVIAVRSGELRTFTAPGVPELELHGLGDEEAAELLTSRLAADVEPGVLVHLLAGAAGNPLALLELPAALSPDQLQGVEPILGPPPVRPTVEHEFRSRVSELPPSTRQILVLAAAHDRGDLDTLRDAAYLLGLRESDLDAAEAAGLVRVAESVVFRHPLVRSAVYRAASRSERKAAHEALAAIVPDRASRAWHRAIVAERASDELAAELEAAGVEAVNRGAQVTAATAFERAAELSLDTAARGHRLTLAAQAAYDGGRPDAARALVERAREPATAALDRIQLDMICASDASRRGAPWEAHQLLTGTAEAIATEAPESACELAMWSVMTALGGQRVEPALDRALELLGRTDTSGPQGRYVTLVLRGMTDLLAGRPDRARTTLTQAAELGAAFTEGTMQPLTAFAGTFTGDFRASREICERALALARRQGSLSSWAGVYPLLAIAQLGEGSIPAAAATIEEGLELARRLGFVNDETALYALQARVAAYRGDEKTCRELADAAVQRSLAVDLAWAADQARLAQAELELGIGNVVAACALLDQLPAVPLPPTGILATPDYVDAAVRTGEFDRARAAYLRFETWSPCNPSPVVLGQVARCGAMLANGPDEREQQFTAALAHHLEAAPAYELARTRLAYGEWLRRERRRTEARVQLRGALDAFEGLGARLWAARARGELDATGEKARKRDVSTLEDLTPQELRIAQLVAEGASNRDVAAQLFVSHKTVEYHLRRVFQKLGVTSRVELARLAVELGLDDLRVGV